jgi:hypothetical protein
LGGGGGGGNGLNPYPVGDPASFRNGAAGGSGVAIIRYTIL